MLADRWARSGASRELQYAGLALYIVAEAVIFLPLIYIALRYAPGVLPKAALITGALVDGLTLVVFTTRTDFAFLAPALAIGGFVALGIIVCSIIFGFNLGTIFAGAMALFAAVAILYNTSNIIHHYRTDQYVSASLSLFASVALLFWYILQIFMSRD